jgi:hypothetical protein
MDTSGDLIARASLDAKMDRESTEWLRALTATGTERNTALERLLRVAFLQACGPCAEDFHGLLAAVTGSPE